jgi:hypothetical protein
MLNEFNYEVEHIRGKDNVVADTLSRFPPDVDAAVTRNVNLPIVTFKTCASCNSTTLF